MALPPIRAGEIFFVAKSVEAGGEPAVEGLVER